MTCNKQCFGEFTPHQLSLSRQRKIEPEKHHLYTALQAKSSPGTQTRRDASFPAGQTPREALGGVCRAGNKASVSLYPW